MAELWYFTRNGQPMDPVPVGELKRLAAAGDLKPTDLVWKEGMPNWVKAESAKGIFDAGGAADVRATPVAERTARRRRVDDDDERPISDRLRRRRDDDDVDDDDAPRKKKRVAAADDWDEDEDRPRRRRRQDEDDDDERPRRRKRKKQATGAGAVIGMIAGGVGVVVVLIIIVAFIATSGTASTEGKYNWSLGVSQKSTYHLRLLAGHRVELRVKSTGQSDVDLFVYDGDVKVMQDEGTSSNCTLDFLPPATKTYRIEVVNREWVNNPLMMARNGANSGTFEYKQIDLSKVAGNNPPPNNVPPNFPQNVPPNFPPNPIVGNPGGATDFRSSGILIRGNKRTYSVQLQANTTYTIDCRSSIFDTFLELQDPAGRMVASDDDGGGDLNARINYRADQTGMYRIIVSAFGDEDGGPFTLTVRH